ncbi:MAG: hypothetical protein RLZZ546_2250 [Bacteroidota bacterium]
MPTIADLFKDRQNDLYDNEKIRIESRGLVNPPRAAALVASSPNAIGDLVGGQIAGIIGGVANRPSDTIYGSDKFFSKPVSIKGVTTGLLQSSVEAGEDYYVKTQPSPIPPLFGKSAPGGSTTAGTIANQAIKAINKLGSKKAVSNLAQQLKEGNAITYGPKYAIGADGKPLNEAVKYSKYKEIRQKYGNEYLVDGLEKRDINDNWDFANNFIQKTTQFESLEAYNTAMKPYVNANQVVVLFKKYGNKTLVPFVGSVTGIAEDISPEWSNFKYVGSPFKVYRYGGVERSLKFNLKIYYFTEEEKSAMIQKINYLKSLTFPYESISEITYGGGEDTAQYAFSPNLFYVSLGDMYKNVFGYMESLSFNVDDNTTWSNFAPNGIERDKNEASLYPSMIEVSISIKIIENHKTEKVDGTTTYRYNFDGNNTEVIKETKESKLTPFNSDGSIKSKNIKESPASFTPPTIRR